MPGETTITTPFVFVNEIGPRPSVLIPVEQHQVDAVKRSHAAHLSGLAFEDAYDSLIAAYLDFGAYLARTSIESSIRGPNSYNEVAAWVRSNNAHALSMLAAARRYIDHTEKNVKALCRHLSEPEIDAHPLLKKEYDARYGYRVLYDLRNGAQHAVIPLHGITWGGGWDADARTGGEVRHHKFEPHIMPSAIEDNWDGYKKSVFEELKSRGARQPFLPLLKEFLCGLSSVHMQLRHALSPLLAIADEPISELFSRASAQVPDTEAGLLRPYPEYDIADLRKVSWDVRDARRLIERQNVATPGTFDFKIEI